MKSKEWILKQLKKHYNKENLEGMARYGIKTENAFGVSINELRKLARKIGHDHQLALGLWQTKIHEARILASMIDLPEMVTEHQMNSWAKDFDSWDLCDQCCKNLFGKTKFAYKKVFDWASRDEEFVKRAAFALMADLSVNDKNAEDDLFLNFLPIIKNNATDDRNYVKKAVNWALRQIGKRNEMLNREAIKTAKEILRIDSKTAQWIASDAIRELESQKVRERL